MGVANQINFLIERLCETDAGPWILNGILYYTLARMAAYYFLMQPAYLRHFQERYGQSWKVGHHLYGAALPRSDLCASLGHLIDLFFIGTVEGFHPKPF